MQNATNKLFNVNLPIELHSALRIWAFNNNETVMEFCRTAILQRMALLKIQPFYGDAAEVIAATTKRVHIAEDSAKGFASYEEALTTYGELLPQIPYAKGVKTYGGTLRIKVMENGVVKYYLAYTPPLHTKKEVIEWRIKYAEKRKDYLNLANCAVFELPVQNPEDFA